MPANQQGCDPRGDHANGCEFKDGYCLPVCGENTPGCAVQGFRASPCGRGTYSDDGKECKDCANNYEGYPGVTSTAMLKKYRYGQTNSMGAAEWAKLGVTSENCPWKITCPAGTTIAETKNGCEKCDLGYYNNLQNLEMTYFPGGMNTSYCKECPSGQGTSNKARTACDSIVIKLRDSNSEHYIQLGKSSKLPSEWFTYPPTYIDGVPVDPYKNISEGNYLGIALEAGMSTLGIGFIHKDMALDASKLKEMAGTPVIYARRVEYASCPAGYYCLGKRPDPIQCPKAKDGVPGMTSNAGAKSADECYIDSNTQFCDKHGCFKLPIGNNIIKSYNAPK